MELAFILHFVPLIAAFGQELIVVLALVVGAVEEIFLIVEAHSIHRERLFLLRLLGIGPNECQQE